MFSHYESICHVYCHVYVLFINICQMYCHVYLVFSYYVNLSRNYQDFQQNCLLIIPLQLQSNNIELNLKTNEI